MSAPPSIPTSLAAARAACAECARGSYTYIGTCVGCQARHVARIPRMSMRTEALEARRGDLGDRWGLFRELARQWHLHDHDTSTHREGKPCRRDQGDTRSGDVTGAFAPSR